LVVPKQDSRVRNERSLGIGSKPDSGILDPALGTCDGSDEHPRSGLFVSRPSIGDRELARIKEVLETGWLGQGAFVEEFEAKLKSYLGARNVVAVSNGTAALHLALAVVGVGSGDEVIVPSLTFCASVQAITALGATPVFCEVSPRTLNIDVQDARARITPRTRAIMPVHYCGNPCDVDALLEIACQHGLRLVEDAAHAFGSSYRGRKLGSFGDIACFSFDPIKNITCGEGGAVCLRDDSEAELARRKRVLGISKGGWQRHTANAWEYQVSTQGYRYHMSNINAAIGLAQLERFHVFIDRKRAIVEQYNREFSGLEGLECLDWNLTQACPFAYVVRVLDGRRASLMEFLRARQVGSAVHYIPNHLHPYFQGQEPLPITERLGEEILTLPLYCDMTDDDVAHVIASVRAAFSQRTRKMAASAVR
jgi:dTDP-4-amino-4,6-dideoxygalactose transaminase